jgi:hypothetical protein
MISLDLKDLLGFDYDFLDDEKNLVAIYTPFFYQDGDSVPVYVEQLDGKCRFFDDGGALWHLTSIGVPLDEPGQEKFVEDLARPCGVSLNDEDELEIFFEPVQARAAFTRFMSAMLAIVRWEYEYLAAFEEEGRRAAAAGAMTTAVSA